MERQKQILQKHVDKLLNLPNVVGVGIGYKVKDGETLDEHAIVALVTKKVSKFYLNEASTIPAELDEIRTDVVEVGEVSLLENTGKMRPAQPGISIGHYKITAGTFGAVVYDKNTKEPLIISNNHVLANVTNGKDGNSAIGDPIYQPGPYDGGTAQDTIAHLHRFVPITYYKTLPLSPVKNKVDTAVAKPISKDLINPEILEIGKVNGTIEAAVGMAVKKNGRTTGFTQGTIQTLHATIKVNMGNNRIAVFEDQIVTGPISAGGDSGSLVLNENNQAVGLLFAGSTETTILCPIANVLSALNVTL